MATLGGPKIRPVRSAPRSDADRAVAAQFAAKLVSDPEAIERRRQRLTRVREAIELNDYENTLKLSVAVDRMIDRHAGRR